MRGSERQEKDDMRIAGRVKRLGGETAFAVSTEAAAFAAKGNKVYPFHLGDINMATPSNIVDAADRAIREGKTGYCPNAGVPRLRELLADDINRSHNVDYTMENVSIQPGGKPVIGKFLLALMNPDDEVLYPNPGYPIYESQIEFHGGRALPYGFIEGKETFELDMDALERQLTSRTRLLIFNDFQNPTGAECRIEDLEKLAELAIRHDLYVLCDESYFDVRYQGKSVSLASFPGMRERCVILYSFSKKFAMTGWRIGAAIGPREVIDVITRLNVNDESCTNHFTQYAAMEGLAGDMREAKAILSTLRDRRDVAVDLLNSIEGVRCFRPNVTFYLYPNVTAAMKKKGIGDYETFRKTLMHETGVSVCTRLHFGRALEGEKEFYIRLAYSGIDVNDISEGLGRFKTFIEG